jgi:hypothetical protein
LELIEQYKTLAAEAAQLEAALEKNKGVRAELAKKLRETNGPKHVYDLGDGVAMIISMTKIRTCFFAPKNKWTKNGPRPPKPPKERKPPRVKAQKGLTRKAIVNGQIVEVPVEPRKRAFVAPPAIAKVESKPPPAPAIAKVEPPPEPTKPTEKELPDDPLERALALVDLE